MRAIGRRTTIGRADRIPTGSPARGATPSVSLMGSEPSRREPHQGDCQMEFTNEFRVPADAETTFQTLTDLERVAPCMPGATLEEVDGDVYSGRMRVKAGPIQVRYQGTAEVTEIDRDAKRARIVATGRETRGGGTAKANVEASLREDGDETVVTVTSQIDVTGKPAQFGRGVMADVGEKIIDQFATRLRVMLSEEDEEPAVAPISAAESASGPRRIVQDPSREDDALDLMEVAGGATVKRLVPVVAALVLLAWLLRRRRA